MGSWGLSWNLKIFREVRARHPKMRNSALRVMLTQWGDFQVSQTLESWTVRTVARGSGATLSLPGMGLRLWPPEWPSQPLPSPFGPVLNIEIPRGARSPWRNLMLEPWGWAGGKSELPLPSWSLAGGEASRHPAEQLWLLHQRLSGGGPDPPAAGPPGDR